MVVAEVLGMNILLESLVLARGQWQHPDLRCQL